MIIFLNESQLIFLHTDNFKYFYPIRIILFTLNHLSLGKWFQELLSNTNYSIQYLSSVCKQGSGCNTNYSHLFAYTVKWFQVLPCITNDSIKHHVICLHTVKWSNSSIFNNSVLHKSFVCKQFKFQTVLFDP